MPELKLSRGGHLYAAFPSKPNPNDNGFPAHLVKRTGDFPPWAVLPGKIGPRRDQKDTGMCTGEGSTGVGMRLYLYWKKVSVIFAPEFTYALERLREGTFDKGDAGADVNTSLEVSDPAMNDPNCIGWCPTDVPGYVPYDIKSKPTPAQMATAKNYPGGAHHNIGNNIANIKSCILSGYSAVIGIAVYDSFEDDSIANTGLIPYPNLEVESLQGGHEMHSALAFDDRIQCPNAPNPGAVLTENSWGQWGLQCPFPSLAPDKGFCWLPYDYLMNPDLASDVRMIHLGKPW